MDVLRVLSNVAEQIAAISPSSNEPTPPINWVQGVPACPRKELEETQCPKCNEEYSFPKILPCAHVLCRKCVVDQLKNDPEQACPVCRCAISKQEKRSSKLKKLEQIADELPTDLAMAALVESVRLLSVKSRNCHVCNNRAKKVCLRCCDFMCDGCANVHASLSISMHHQVEPLSSLTPRILSARLLNSPAIVETVTTLKCPKHGATICLFCATRAQKAREAMKKKRLEETKRHKEMLDAFWGGTIEDTVKRMEEALLDRLVKEAVERYEKEFQEKCPKLFELIQLLTDKEDKIDQDIFLLDQYLDELTDHPDRIEKDFDAVYIPAEADMVGRRRVLTTHLQQKMGEMKEKLQAYGEVLQARYDRLNSHKQLVERVIETVPADSIVQMVDCLEKRVGSLDFNNEIPSELMMTPWAFVIDLDAIVRLQDELETRLTVIGMNQVELEQRLIEERKTRVDSDIEEWKRTKGPQLQDTKEKQPGQDQTDPSTKLCFHNLHGENVELSEGNQLATRMKGEDCGMVFSAEPIKPGNLYEVEIAAARPKFSGCFVCGLVVQDDLASLPLPLPRLAFEWDHGYVIRCDHIRVLGRKVESDIGVALACLRKGAVIGFARNAKGDVYLYKNGKEVGLVVPRLVGPCYTFFALEDAYSQIKALPVKVLSTNAEPGKEKQTAK